MTLSELQRASVSSLRQLFSQLPAASQQARQGFYRAQFIGPAWLRISAGPSVALSGLPGWQGKRFIDEKSATNVLSRKGARVEKLLMQCNSRTSLVDGQPGVDLSYGQSGPIPWRWIRDELRQLDENTLLGMTIIELPLLNKLSFPFLLSREDVPAL